MPSLDLVTRFILSFLDSICTIYISSYSMKNYQSIIHLCQSLHGIRATIQTSPFLFSLVVDSPPLLLGFHPSSHPLPPPLPPILPTSWLKNNTKSPSLLTLLYLLPSSTYPIKTLLNSNQQTTSPRSFKLKLSSSVTTSINYQRLSPLSIGLNSLR